MPTTRRSVSGVRSLSRARRFDTLPPSGRPLDVADYTVERDGEIIRCPWHLWEFEIATGRCLVDSRARVKTYPVHVEEDRVVVYADPVDLPPQ